MKGIITFYINFHPDLNQVAEECVEIFRQCNKDLIAKINEEGTYLVAVVPTTKEACRIEKMDFDKPFPRFVSKNHIDIAELERRKEERAIERAIKKQRDDIGLKEKGE